MPQFPTTSLSYAPRAGFLSVFPAPLIMQRAPTTSDRALPGTIWVNQATGSQAAFILLGIFNGSASWVSVEGGAGAFTSLTVTPGRVLIDSDNNTGNDIIIQTNGGTNETLVINNTQGTGTPALQVAAVAGQLQLLGGLANVAAININATNAAGGITSTSGTGGFTVGTSGSMTITSTQNANTAIRLLANGGTGEQILLQAQQGTSGNSVQLSSPNGGVTADGATNVTLVSTSTTPLINIANVAPAVNRVTNINGGALLTAHSDTVNISTGGLNNGGATKAVNIATGANAAGAQTVTIGNSDGNTVTNINYGLRVTAVGGASFAQILTGTANPNGSVTASNGSLYIRTGTSTATTTLYVNTDGAMAWTALT